MNMMGFDGVAGIGKSNVGGTTGGGGWGVEGF